MACLFQVTLFHSICDIVEFEETCNDAHWSYFRLIWYKQLLTCRLKLDSMAQDSVFYCSIKISKGTLSDLKLSCRKYLSNYCLPVRDDCTSSLNNLVYKVVLTCSAIGAKWYHINSAKMVIGRHFSCFASHLQKIYSNAPNNCSVSIWLFLPHCNKMC